MSAIFISKYAKLCVKMLENKLFLVDPRSFKTPYLIPSRSKRLECVSDFQKYLTLSTKADISGVVFYTWDSFWDTLYLKFFNMNLQLVDHIFTLCNKLLHPEKL